VHLDGADIVRGRSMKEETREKKNTANVFNSTAVKSVSS